uniref:Uncharacterized protein n=1 Tax=Sphaerodactylus townsendi TaxID=933632 RepID=A0ACB8EA74_9SAUR
MQMLDRQVKAFSWGLEQQRLEGHFLGQRFSSSAQRMPKLPGPKAPARGRQKGRRLKSVQGDQRCGITRPAVLASLGFPKFARTSMATEIRKDSNSWMSCIGSRHWDTCARVRGRLEPGWMLSGLEKLG